MMTEKDIKPCPFCGGKAGVVSDGYFCVVMCDKCGAETRTFVANADYAVKEKAIEAWNRRADTNGRNEKDV